MTSYIRQVMSLTGRELKHWYRSKMQIVMVIIQPLIWLGLFGFAMSGFIDEVLPEGMSYFSFLAMGMIIITALTTSMNAGMSVVWDRRFGFLDKLRAAPIPRGIIPLSKVLSTTVKAVIQSMLVLVIALLLGLDLKAGFGVLDLLAIIVAVMCVAVTFSSIFVALGMVIKNQEVLMGVNMLLNLPLMFASGAMFPTTGFPSWLKAVADVNPLTYASDAVRQAGLGTQEMLSTAMSFGENMIIIVIVAIVAAALGMFFARRALKT